MTTYLNEIEDMLIQVQNQEGDYLATLELAIEQVHKLVHAKCQSLTVVINGTHLQEHFEGCDVYAPGVLVNMKTGDIYKNTMEARQHLHRA